MCFPGNALRRAHRFRGVVWAGAVLWLVALFVVSARDKAFWLDEICTILAASLPLGSLWQASKDGIDLAPPLNTVAVHVVQGALGVGPLVTRLPALAGFLAAATAVFTMATRRAGVAVGLAALLALASTTAWRYALETRGYGLTLGLFAVALYAWSEAALGRRSAAHWALMAVAVAAGVWTHYYCVLAVLPIVAGEGVRQLAARRFDRAPWMALAAAGAATLPLAPLVEAAARQRATFWARPHSVDVRGIYTFLQADFGLPRVVLALLAALAAAEVLRRRRGRESHRRLPAHEVAAGVACLLLPLACVAVGQGSGVFDPRYAIFTSAGLALAVPLAAWVLTPDGGAADLVLVAALVVGAVQQTSAAVRVPPLWQNPYLHRSVLASRLVGSEPVVIAGGADYLPMWFYAPEGSRGRAVYLADPAAELRDTGADSIDREYLALARWTDVPVESLDAFVSIHPRFWLYSTVPGWTEKALADRGASMTVTAKEAVVAGTLFEVVVPAR